MIDVNVHLSRWPFRHLRGDETEELVAKLRAQNVIQAWAGSFDGLLHRDLAGVNRRLAKACHSRGDHFLLPFGTVNPLLPDWEEDLRRCHEDLQMPGIRLYPNYHGYSLDHPRLRILLQAAGERGCLVQIAIRMEDERAAHPLMRVAPVDPLPLLRSAAVSPQLKLILLNSRGIVNPEHAGQLTVAGRVFFDIAMLEGLEGITRLLRSVSAERVLFGSHAPLFYVESAVLKLRESVLDLSQARAIQTENARRLLSKEA